MVFYPTGPVPPCRAIAAFNPLFIVYEEALVLYLLARRELTILLSPEELVLAKIAFDSVTRFVDAHHLDDARSKAAAAGAAASGATAGDPAVQEPSASPTALVVRAPAERADVVLPVRADGQAEDVYAHP